MPMLNEDSLKQRGSWGRGEMGLDSGYLSIFRDARRVTRRGIAGILLLCEERKGESGHFWMQKTEE